MALRLDAIMYESNGEETYCYPPDYTVLINKYGIKDLKKLNAVEGELSSANEENFYKTRFQTLAQEPFSVDTLKDIHKTLFGKLYDWAEEFRTVRISKEDSHFCYPENIAAKLEDVFLDIRNCEAFSSVTYEKCYALHLAKVMAEVNSIHPFREGNGRTQRLFLNLLAYRNQRRIYWAQASRQSVTDCTIASHQGEGVESRLFQWVEGRDSLDLKDFLEQVNGKHLLPLAKLIYTHTVPLTAE
jgi:cell filamentation protein